MNNCYNNEFKKSFLQITSARLATRANMVVLSQPSVALALSSLCLGSQLVTSVHQVFKKNCALILSIHPQRNKSKSFIFLFFFLLVQVSTV